MTVDLSTTYMGLTLTHPVIPAASPLSMSLDGIRRLEEAGASAVVLCSLFAEQLEAESHAFSHYLSHGRGTYGAAISYFPDLGRCQVRPEQYLKLIAQGKRSVGVPIIASLNGVSAGGWVKYARLVEQAGADALELNIYFIPADPLMTGVMVEQLYLDVLREVKHYVSIPVAVKLSPFFSSVACMARRLSECGADGLVLFNRFVAPDFDLETLEVLPQLTLSDSHELRLPLRWTALLHGRVEADLAITGGVHTHEDVLKAMMAGAKVVQLASELLEHGPGRIGEMVSAMARWLEERGYDSVARVRGVMSQRDVAEPGAFERASYMRALASYRS